MVMKSLKAIEKPIVYDQTCYIGVSLWVTDNVKAVKQEETYFCFFSAGFKIL